MLKAQYNKRGPVPEDVIEAINFKLPPLEGGQALIEVLASPINPSDILTLTGEYGILPPLPAVGGNEGVGRITRLGPGATSPAIGKTVLLPVGGGTWTSHMVAEANTLISLPDNADPRQLAMMTINPPAASLMLSEFIDLKPGDWVIQNAANSGVGGYLIQLSKIRGFKTVNIVRRESAVAALKESGADIVLVDDDSLSRRVAEATDRAKIRLGIDAVGGEATDRMAECLCNNATLVNYGMMSGEPCVISPGSLVFRNITLKGFWLAKWYQQASQQEQISVFSELAQYITNGKLKSKIHGTFDISHIKEAIKITTKGERNGKVLIVP